MSKQNNLTDFLTDVADAIREKKGTSEKINPQNFSEEIRSIESGESVEVNTFGETMVGDMLGLTAVKKVVFSSDVTSIAAKSYNDMPNLESVELGNISTIGNYAFRRCSNLKTIQMSNTVKSIGSYAFAESGLQGTITIPEGVTIINEATFYNTQIDTINLPDSIQEIKSWAFEACRKLTSIDIPKNVNVINNGAFSNSGIETMILRNPTPPTLVGTIPATTIYVPADSVEAYKSHTNWAKYADKILPISE
jgi:hypothetical protein